MTSLLSGTNVNDASAASTRVTPRGPTAGPERASPLAGARLPVRYG